MMNSGLALLLGDTFAPITSEIGYIEAETELVVRTFIEWQSTILAPTGATLASRSAVGDLGTILSQLLPLTSPRPRRFAFVGTDGPWTAYFDNGASGTDAFSVPSFLASRCNCRALRIAAVVDSSANAECGELGARILELYGPEGGVLGHIRSIAVVNEGNRWVYESSGRPLSFEEADQDEKLPPGDRLSFETMRRYLAFLGIRPFDEDFYSHEKAFMVDIHGKAPKGMRSFTLEEARFRFREKARR